MTKRGYSPKAKPSVEYRAPTYTGLGWTSIGAVFDVLELSTGSGANQIPEESYVFGGYMRLQYAGHNVDEVNGIMSAGRYAMVHLRKGESAPTTLDEAYAEKKFMAGELHRYGCFAWGPGSQDFPLYLKFRRTKLSEGESIHLYVEVLEGEAAGKSLHTIESYKAFFKRL